MPMAKPPAINLPTVPCWHQTPLPSGSSHPAVAFCSRYCPGLRHVVPARGWDVLSLVWAASLSPAAAQRTDGSTQSSLEVAAALSTGRARGIPVCCFWFSCLPQLGSSTHALSEPGQVGTGWIQRQLPGEATLFG